MSDTWVPKGGDRVMVGEHGPYFVAEPVLAGGGWDLRTHTRWVAKNVPSEWLTPVPEPEPEEPTAPGALVRDGEGALYLLTNGMWKPVVGYGAYKTWQALARPVTVVVADPAEVEQLRAERDAYRKAKQENDERFQLEAARQRERADELQRRIDAASLRYRQGYRLASVIEVLGVES